MMLTRLLLRPDDIRKLRITDAYSLHRVVYSCFPLGVGNTPRGESASFLYVEEGIHKGVLHVLILSEQAPQSLPCGVMEHKPIPEGWLEHSAYAFKITINPVRRENASRKIVSIKGRGAIQQWFCAKAPTWGMHLAEADCRVEEDGVWQFMKKEQPVTMAYARISGTLQVRDPGLFKEAFRRGVGRGKSFGCGMLQLIPLA